MENIKAEEKIRVKKFLYDVSWRLIMKNLNILEGIRN